MNGFGSSQSGEIKKINSNLEHSIKSYSDKLNKIEHLIEENHTSIQLQEEQTEKLELTCLDITEHMIKAEVTLQTILEAVNDLKKNITCYT